MLYKHPDKVQVFNQSFGTATVFYPEATEERCTAALLLEVDPVRLARSAGRDAPDFALAQYVNDRSYAASSLLSAAMANVFRTARAGRADSHQALADTALPLEITIPVLPCRGGPAIAHRVFAPLGWQVKAQPIPLDERFARWGDSRYIHLKLEGNVRLADALNQLYVLLPVLDESKHYWQANDEVDKLLRSGEGWLATHPDRELITRRYLKRSRALANHALARLAELAELPELTVLAEPAGPPEGDVAASATNAIEAGQRSARPAPGPFEPLKSQRHQAVLSALLELGAQSVIDLGCGQGALLERLVLEPTFTRIAGADVSIRALQQAARRLRLDELSERQAQRITLFQGALTYIDERFAGYDAAVLMEVIEHIDPARLGALERVVFQAAQPAAVLVTTPNSEYNANYDLPGLRHPDHRFEWNQTAFSNWAERVGATHGYSVQLRAIGERDANHLAPTQMGVFQRV